MKIIIIDEETKYKLLSSYDDKMIFDWWLRCNRDSLLSLSHYRKLSKEENNFINLYYKTIKIAINKGIDLSNILSFIFIHGIQRAKVQEYIEFIFSL